MQLFANPYNVLGLNKWDLVYLEKYDIQISTYKRLTLKLHSNTYQYRRKMVGRRIVAVRHGERVDYTFTNDWLNMCFENGKYKKHNLNMPDTVPKRKGSPKTFMHDCPLTQVGVLQAKLTGKGLVEQNVLEEGFEVYVSPSIRSVQTAVGIAEGMGVDFSLKIEPCLYEGLGWYENDEFMPTLMSVPELKENGYNVDETYSSFLKVEDINPKETSEDVYQRSHQLMLHLLAKTDKDILLVGHAPTLDTATRLLSGGQCRTGKELLEICLEVPYCGVAVAEQDLITEKWSVIPVSNITLKHNSVEDYCAAKYLSLDR